MRVVTVKLPRFAALWRSALLCLALLWTPALPGMELTKAVGVREAVRLLGADMAVLEDEEGGLTLADVLAKTQDFRPAPANGLVRKKRGYGALWLRFTLSRSAEAPSDWWLQVRPATIDWLSLYVPGADGYTERRSGDGLPTSMRESAGRDFTFQLELPANAAQTYYLRLAWEAALPASLRLWQANGLALQAERDGWILGAFFGLLAFTLLLNATLWVWLRESIYWAYSAYLLTLGGFLLFVNGFVTQWLFTDTPGFGNEFQRFIVFATLATTTWFFVPMLQLRSTAPRIGRILTGLTWFYLACLPASYVWGYADVMKPCQIVRTVQMPLMFAIDGIFLLRPGFRFYILAFLPQQIVSLLYMANILGLVTAEIRLETGATVHMVLLNLALAGRIHRAERERRQAQDEALSIVRESEQMLESRVAQRSAELSEANTALRQEVAERGQLQAQLQDALATQRQFVAMVSHEFRTPLAIIDATAQRLSFATAAVADVGERMEKIRRAVRRMDQLIDNLLTEGRMADQGLCPRLVPLDLGEIAREAAEQHQPLFAPPLALEVCADLPASVQGDRTLLLLAVANLLQNAAKYSPEGGKVALQVRIAAGWAELAVEDQGMGIGADDLPQVFERHYRSGKSRVGGAGLGLYITREIARAHGGDIGASSVPGKGSRFVLSLPLRGYNELKGGLA